MGEAELTQKLMNPCLFLSVVDFIFDLRPYSVVLPCFLACVFVGSVLLYGVLGLHHFRSFLLLRSFFLSPSISLSLFVFFWPRVFKSQVGAPFV